MDLMYFNSSVNIPVFAVVHDNSLTCVISNLDNDPEDKRTELADSESMAASQ